MAKAYVHNELTLGMLWGDEKTGLRLEVLAGKQGFKCAFDNPFCVTKNEVRPATKKDFEKFNVKFHADYI